MTPSIIFKSHQEMNDYKGSNHDLDYIDHELSINLDSTNAFEGPEKLLELWFSPNADSLPFKWPKNGLRCIPLNEIESLLNIVNCEILSKISSDNMDAYLLSESSLFIYPNKFILKTCGTTLTLLCLTKLKELIINYCNDSGETFDNIYRVFYSRRSYLFPERQKSIHKSWELELKYLHEYFDESSSESHILGRCIEKNTTDTFNDDDDDDDGGDNWYLYINGHNKFEEMINDSNSESNSCITAVNNIEDFSIELIMTDLDIEKAKQFELKKYDKEIQIKDPETQDIGHLLGDLMMKRCKLDKIISKPNKIKHDAFAFTPCGYSSNTILDYEMDNFYTIHITPEKGWSYASFETNFQPESKQDVENIVKNVIDILKPGKFSLVMFNEKKGIHSGMNMPSLLGYREERRCIRDVLHGYELVYLMYSSV